MEIQKNIIPKKEMKVIPFRIEPSLEEDNYSEVYCFIIKGNSKEPYEVQIEIDSFNNLGITDTRCTCPHYTFRQLDCKHIELCKKILNEFGIKTDIINKTIDIMILPHAKAWGIKA